MYHIHEQMNWFDLVPWLYYSLGEVDMVERAVMNNTTQRVIKKSAFFVHVHKMRNFDNKWLVDNVVGGSRLRHLSTCHL